MKPFEFNKYSSALKQWLRDVLQKHERAYAFQKSKAYSQSLKKMLETLRTQEDQFVDFVIHKQKDIDEMEQGFFKEKMQEHLDRIAVNTYGHLNKLNNKYQRMLEGNANSKQ